MSNIPISYSVRLAIVKKVGKTFVDFQFIDQIDNQTFRCPIPHPYAGRGGGIFVGIEKDSLILVSNGFSEKWYCVATIPDHNFYFDLGGASNIKYDETSYPDIKEGEIILKGNKRQHISFKNNGNIGIDAGIGSSSYDIELSRSSSAMFRRINQDYLFTEAGRSIEGIIKRDIRQSEDTSYAGTTNFLDGENYDSTLNGIGRFPYDEVNNRTTKMASKRTLRNPALVEKRNIVYEYANEFNVQSFQKEVDALKDVETEDVSEISSLQTNPSFRKNRRTDILNLNLLNFNHLIEKVEGTVVDIYGNILDINRNKINLPDTASIDFNKNGTEQLRQVYDYLRRSVKFHYEINSRKSLGDASEPPDTDKDKNNAKNFSRWSVDVDGEGLTKINIPSSSETGNIPVLGRYFNSRDRNDEESGSFRDNKRIDVRLKQFGAKDGGGKEFAGQKIVNDDYLPKTDSGNKSTEDVVRTTGTAFHNLMDIANSIFTAGKFKSSNKALVEKINNKISSAGEVPDSTLNAGGRSIHANLDGSMEMSIGADSSDRKSIVLDTGGGVISHLGRDRNGRSLIQQTDGDIIIQVGGKGISSDDRFKANIDIEDRPGRIEIHLNRPNGTPQKIIIDENGITFDIQQSMYFRSTGDMVFDCGATMLLSAEQILEYGSGNIDERSAGSSEIKVRRKGRA